MKRITLKKLKCIVMEDYTGTDSAKLEVFIDNNPSPRVFRKELKDGKSFSINESFLFNDNVLIKLYEEDDYDSDDYLGKKRIRNITDNGKVNFERDEAHYKLTYIVAEEEQPQATQTDMLSAFRASNVTGPWLHLHKQIVINEIESRLSTPELVNQAHTPTCGPASIIFELIRKKPQTYVRICQELFESGQFMTPLGRTIRPNESLFATPFNLDTTVTPLAEVDWMLIATMRDVANAIFDILHDEDWVGGLSGISTPSEMMEWTIELLEYSNTFYLQTYLHNEQGALDLAKAMTAVGGVAFILLDGRVLKGDPIRIFQPNHWVPYLGGYNGPDRNEMISYNCYTWGGIDTFSASTETFEDCTFGVVVGV